MSDLEVNKRKSIDYGNYQINIFDDGGKMVVGIKKENFNFFLKNGMSYSEKFNFVAESDSTYNIITVFFYNKREKTPLFRLPISFIDEIIEAIEIPVFENVRIECSIVFGSVAGFLVEKIIIEEESSKKIKETYIENFLSDLNKSQRMYNFVSFSSGTARMTFEMEEKFLTHLIDRMKKELDDQINQFKNRTDYFNC